MVNESFNHKAWQRIDKLPAFDLRLKVQDHALCAFQVVLFYWCGKAPCFCHRSYCAHLILMALERNRS